MNFSSELLLLIILQATLIFLLYQKIRKLKREQKFFQEKEGSLEIFKESLFHLPLEIFLSRDSEILFQNKKALETFGPLKRIEELQNKRRKKEKIYQTEVINLRENYKLYLLLDITELKKYKEGYQMALSYLSHELKTPLAVAKSYFEKLEEILTLRESKEKETFQKAKEALEKLEKLLKQILRGIEVLKEIKISEEKISLKKCIEEALFWITPLAEDKKISFSIEGEEDFVIPGSEEFLTQAFFNLIENAVKASPEGGIIYIKILRGPSEGIIIIRDFGKGVPPESLPLLTVPFFKLEPSEGMGLGLFITERIILAHKGTLNFYLPPEGGLEVVVKLPLSLQ